jgi:pyrroline-5-carboxylate reductase
MADLAGPLLVVGGGKMGGALLAGWLAAGLAPSDAYIVEPDAARAEALRRAHGVTAVAAAASLPQGLRPRALLLAVKPQMMAAALPDYRDRLDAETLILSIAAGKPIGAFEAAFGADRAIVRAMPNTPAAIGRGASVLCANARVTEAQRSLATALLAAVGEVHWVEDEDLLHAVTAMSGGGPAYVFLLIEALAAAGAKLGLPAGLAMRLARTTVAGSGELARLSGAAAAQLRIDVTSPGGTTQAALAVLMAEDGLQPLLDRALAAAAARSRALA